MGEVIRMKPKAYYFDINKKFDDVINSVQFDKNSRFIEVNFLSNSQAVNLTGYRATIRAIKPDKTEVFNELKEIDASIGKYELELTEQLNSVAGDVLAQFEIYGEGESLFTTSQFKIGVSQSLSREKTTSSDELGVLVSVMAEAQQYKNNFAKIDAKIDDEVAKTNAQLSNVNLQLSEAKQELINDIGVINNHILDIKDLPDNLNLHRLGRKFFPEKTGIYCNSQAMCCVEDKIVVQSYQLFEGNDVKLVKMNVETGQELASNIINNGYHCNGMCYNTNDRYIYITPAHNYDESEFLKTVIKVDSSTLAHEDTIDITSKTKLRYIASIAYDEINNQFIVNCDNEFEIYDLEWNLIDGFIMESYYDETRFQTITCKDGRLYQITSAPETIWIYDLFRKKLLKTLNLETWQDLFFNLGEIEGIAFNPVTNDVYLSSQSRFTKTVGGTLTQFWITRFDRNMNSSNNLYQFKTAQQETQVFVNASNINYNPTGEFNNPFPTLAEACATLASPCAGNKVLNLQSDFEETLMITESLSNLVVNGGANYSIKALILLHATNIYIPSLRLSGYSTFNNNGIYLYMSELTTTSIAYTVPPVELDNYTFIERSKLTAPKSFLNATDIHHFMKNSEVYVQSRISDKLKYTNLIKENENSTFNGMKWCNGGILATTATLPKDWRYYRKAKVVFRIDSKAEIYQDALISNDEYTIRLSAVYQNDNNELYQYSAYLKPENGVYKLGTSTGASFIDGIWSRIDNPLVLFDIAFYD